MGIPSKYLHTLSSFFCKASIVVLHVGTTALPNNRDGIAMSFQMAFPTTALSALFFTSCRIVLTFLSAMLSSFLFSFSKMSLHLPPMVMPRYLASVTISFSPILCWVSGPLIFMIFVVFSFICECVSVCMCVYLCVCMCVYLFLSGPFSGIYLGRNIS